MATSDTYDRLHQNNAGEKSQGKTNPEDYFGAGGILKGSLTSDFYRCKEMPERFNHPDWFKGYGAKPTHPMFRTSNSAYGSHKPSVHTMQTSYHTMPQEFTSDLTKGGMYRNHSLNCAMDKSVGPQS